MKITKEQLRRVIQEELENVMGESAVAAAAKKLHKFVGDQYGGSKSKNGKKNKHADKSRKETFKYVNKGTRDTSDTLDEVSMDDLTDLNDPDRDAKPSDQAKLKNLFKAIQNLDSRISKLEGSKSSAMGPRYKG